MLSSIGDSLEYHERDFQGRGRHVETRHKEEGYQRQHHRHQSPVANGAKRSSDRRCDDDDDDKHGEHWDYHNNSGHYSSDSISKMS